MEAVVVYDPRFGHTEKIARTVAEATGGQVFRVDDVDPAELANGDLLIVGSPTHGGFPTGAISSLVRGSLALDGVWVVASDTRTRMTIFGYAAPKIARSLEGNGGSLVAPPEGFFVFARKAPLQDGELVRAAE